MDRSETERSRLTGLWNLDRLVLTHGMYKNEAQKAGGAVTGMPNIPDVSILTLYDGYTAFSWPEKWGTVVSLSCIRLIAYIHVQNRMICRVWIMI